LAIILYDLRVHYIGVLMSIVSSESKVLKILQRVRENFPKNFEHRIGVDTEEVLRVLVEDFTRGEYSFGDYTSILVPLESLTYYECNRFDASREGAVSYLVSERVSVLAFDGSVHGFGAHFYVPLTIVNLGYWYQNYGVNDNGFGNEAAVIPEIATPSVRRVESKKAEYVLLEGIVDRLVSDFRIVLYDESFNLRYTLSWDVKTRNDFLKIFEDHINGISSRGIVPVAVFYTSASDIIRGYNSKKGGKKKFDVEIPDKFLMNRFLNIGARSNLFKVYTRSLANTKLDIVAFYLKISENNVIRVEFPQKFESLVDKIHCTVLAQAILGEGYPLAMQRAHEWAVLTHQDRLLIEEEIAKLLGKPYADMFYSAKLRSKRRPIS